VLITLFGENKNRRQGEPKLSKSYLNTYIFRTIGRFQKIDYQKAAFGNILKNIGTFGRMKPDHFAFIIIIFPFRADLRLFLRKTI
jgi:hypothetical protein